MNKVELANKESCKRSIDPTCKDDVGAEASFSEESSNAVTSNSQPNITWEKDPDALEYYTTLENKQPETSLSGTTDANYTPSTALDDGSHTLFVWKRLKKNSPWEPHTKVNFAVDATVPTISSVTSLDSSSTFSAGSEVFIDINFSEIVNVVGTPTLLLSSGGTAVYVSGSGTSVLKFKYTVGSSDTAADLDVANANALSTTGGSITDEAGNSATSTVPVGSAEGSLAGNSTIVIVGNAPTITSVTSSTSNGSYNTGDVINITVTFSTAVTVSGTPRITLETGSTDAVVNYTSGSGSTSLVFNYTVGASDTCNNLDYTSTSSLSLNGGSIVSTSSSTAAVLTLPTIGGANSISGQKSIVIDTAVPTVSSVSSSTSDGSYNGGDSITVVVTFSEAVTVTGTPQLTLETGASDAVVNYSTAGAATTMSFTFVVSAGYTTSDLELASTSALSLNSGTIRDAAGNNATLTVPTSGGTSLSGQKAIVIDTTLPTITYTSISPGTSGRTQTPSVTLALSEASSTNGLRLYSDNTCSASASNTATGSSGSNALTTSSLSTNTGTSLYAKATDIAGNNSSCTSLVTYTHDTVAPGAPTSLSPTAGSAQVALSWTAATGTPSAYMVVRCTAACNTAPTAGTAYVATDTLGNGTVISVASGTSYTSTGLTNGTTYYYSVYAQDAAVNWSTAATTSATPASSGGSGGNSANRFIFVTSTTYTGSQLGENGSTASTVALADAACMTRGNAGAQSLGKLASNWSWNALLGSKTYTPRQRLGLPASVNYKNISSTTVATSEAQLFNDASATLSSTLAQDENGAAPSSTTPWTGATVGTSCTNWSSSDAGVYGSAGLVGSTDANWYSEDVHICSSSRSIYCINTPPAYIFVTSTTHNGDLTAEGGPDAYCTTLATAGTSITKDLGVTRWRAVTPGNGNPGITPRAKLALPYNLNVYLSDGTTLVATTESQLFNDNSGALSAAITKDENGTTVSNATTWAGTTAAGCFVNTGTFEFFKTSSNSNYSNTSSTSVTNIAWWFNNTSPMSCDNAYRFICIGQ